MKALTLPLGLVAAFAIAFALEAGLVLWLGGKPLVAAMTAPTPSLPVVAGAAVVLLRALRYVLLPALFVLAIARLALRHARREAAHQTPTAVR